MAKGARLNCMSEALDQAIQKTISAIETVAPQAWSLLVQSQRVDALEGILVTTFLSIAAIAAMLLIPYAMRKCNTHPDDVSVGLWVSRIVGSLVLLFTLSFMIGDILQYCNADIYAARYLLSRIP